MINIRHGYNEDIKAEIIEIMEDEKVLKSFHYPHGMGIVLAQVILAGHIKVQNGEYGKIIKPKGLTT